MDNMELLRKTNKREVATVYGNDRIHHILRNLVNPVKYDLYRLLWNEATKLCYTPKHPLQIDFELNESCNFSCPTCSWSLEKGKYSSPLFGLSDYQEIVKDGTALWCKELRSV